jgi:glyoxylase-like metal-dependent hydrolase (beta-lactamase superfamily II)
LKVRRLEVGPLAANCYLVWKEAEAAAPRGGGAGGHAPCLAIDPGAEPETILAALDAEGLRPEMVVATHCHGDHIGAVDELLAAFPDAAFAAGEAEAKWPADPVRNLSYGFGMPMRMANPSRLLTDGEELRCAGLVFQVMSVPGHSPGSVALYCPEGKAVFTGDTLFALNIGRGDLPGGDGRLLVRSIREKILALPDETVVWPGHANRTRVGTERRSNPFCGKSAAFLM